MKLTPKEKRIYALIKQGPKFQEELGHNAHQYYMQLRNKGILINRTIFQTNRHPHPRKVIIYYLDEHSETALNICTKKYSNKDIGDLLPAFLNGNSELKSYYKRGY